MRARAFQIHPGDTVATLIDALEEPGPVECIGAAPAPLVAREPIAAGHKIAVQDIASGAAVLKYGTRIGHATEAIPRGAWVHLHNLASDLDARSATLDPKSGVPSDTRDAYV